MTADATFIITFVCTGNTCRSPMAEVIARKIIEENNIDGVEVCSAGTMAALGSPASEGARRAAAEAGLDLADHRSLPLTEGVVEASDLILAMGASHVARVLELGGAGRVHRLKDYAGAGGEVLDPFGAPDEVYRSTFEELEEHLRAFFSKTPGPFSGP